jgi:hypothetical protein
MVGRMVPVVSHYTQKSGIASDVFAYSPELQFDEIKVIYFIKKNPTRCNNVSKFYYSISI